ncbi:ABC-type polysaccharide/polyol phosphate transport system, ATPase component [Neorhodopirellula lusitana]|uniref:ABC-type polysaccharide/polyol phosphate transport system, ATPase component n=1 Tax=Neorhodopirellula lusitana TaxID=445327 RepID=A0ABY1PRS6_9BACT|nr:ABC transporter ATP-binding protein [Neorhodopirellula lusitana]SMP44100.1 ABC-type polysaccharide/polyol phosphate transport system, ATPase component [Neorhodopirellula lusitana]
MQPISNPSCDHAISAQGISKAYRLAKRQTTPDTLVGAIQAIAKAPLRNFQYLRSLGRAHHAAKLNDEDLYWALQDVSFDVPAGEVVGVIGRNGAGKSTLLKILSRITQPTSGEATIRGRVSSLLEVGTGFHPELTGRENVYMNGTILGMTKREIDRKFDQIVDFAGVDRFLDTPIKRYSSGMQVRLAFSVAAHLDPDILIIDEVLAVGDAEFQKRCIGKMQEVAGGGRTVMFVSHNMSAIGQLCTSGLLLSKGRVASQGDLGVVVQSYMDDLFSTESKVGNEETTIIVQTAIDGDESERMWRYGSMVRVRVEVDTQLVIANPAIDLYFNSSAGRMIFAQSDRFVKHFDSDSNRWVFEFQLRNNGFVSDYMTIDVGFRYCSSTRYLGLWQSVAAIALGEVPAGHTHGRDCPIAVPCEVQLMEAAA